MTLAIGLAAIILGGLVLALHLGLGDNPYDDEPCEVCGRDHETGDCAW